MIYVFAQQERSINTVLASDIAVEDMRIFIHRSFRKHYYKMSIRSDEDKEAATVP
jgi:hypothetical protein